MNFNEFKAAFQKKEVEEFPNKVSKRPLLSVCVQTYQQKDYIEDCLLSILHQQTDFSYEILLGDDNSSDGTREVCEYYARKHPDKIRLFLHYRENLIKVMGEPTSSFNAFYNFFSARGTYIAFCEGDDLWGDPFKLQKQVDFLRQNSDFVFSYHKYIEIDHEGNTLTSFPQIIQPEKDIGPDELKKAEAHPLLLTICFRKVLDEVPNEIFEVLNVDTFFLSLLGEYGKAKFHSDIKPSQYRRHVGGLWTTRIRKMKLLSKIRTYRRLFSYYVERNDLSLARHYNELIKNHYKMLLVMEFKQGRILFSLKILRDFLALGRKPL